ncbi:MAG: TolC family protein [Candidatus Omnitrophota bacterium]|jgi:outer membrane protein TolC|nr:MAG: TolC family protein [Candidatus Omnitrophota bacterium]
MDIFSLREHCTKIIMIFIMLIMFTTITGCMTSFIREDDPRHTHLLETDVNKIDSIALDALSQSTPISIEDAAHNYLNTVLKVESATKTIELNLEEVRASALANNLDLIVQLVNPTLANELLHEERAKFEAVFYGSLSYSKSDTPTSTQLEGSKAANTFFETGIRQLLPTGGQLDMSWSSSRYETDNRFATLNPAFNSDLTFSFSQPLLRNAGLRANTHTIRVTKLQKKIADAQTKLESIRVLALADKAYWNVYAASRELEVARQQYDLARKQLNDANNRVKSEAAPQIEITRAESGLAARMEEIIRASTTMQLQMRELKRIMNRADLPLDSTNTINLKSEPNPIGLQLDPATVTALAIQNRMEMLELELRLAVDESVIDFARNGKLPFFAVDYQYNLNGLGSQYGGAYEVLNDGKFADYAARLRGEIPLGNQAANARFRQAMLLRVQRLATKELREQTIRQETLNALDQLQQNWQRILAARQDVIFAGRTYEAERRQFELGVRTSTDVLDAAARLAAAQLREIHALVDYQIAQVDIAYAAGALLGHAQVQWEALTIN